MRELRRPLLMLRQCSTGLSRTCFLWGTAGDSSRRQKVRGDLSVGGLSRVPTRVLHRIFFPACAVLRFVVFWVHFDGMGTDGPLAASSTRRAG